MVAGCTLWSREMSFFILPQTWSFLPSSLSWTALSGQRSILFPANLLQCASKEAHFVFVFIYVYFESRNCNFIKTPICNPLITFKVSRFGHCWRYVAALCTLCLCIHICISYIVYINMYSKNHISVNLDYLEAASHCWNIWGPLSTTSDRPFFYLEFVSVLISVFHILCFTVKILMVTI